MTKKVQSSLIFFSVWLSAITSWAGPNPHWDEFWAQIPKADQEKYTALLRGTDEHWVFTKIQEGDSIQKVASSLPTTDGAVSVSLHRARTRIVHGWLLDHTSGWSSAQRAALYRRLGLEPEVHHLIEQGRKLSPQAFSDAIHKKKPAFGPAFTKLRKCVAALPLQCALMLPGSLPPDPSWSAKSTLASLSVPLKVEAALAKQGVLPGVPQPSGEMGGRSLVVRSAVAKPQVTIRIKVPAPGATLGVRWSEAKKWLGAVPPTVAAKARAFVGSVAKTARAFGKAVGGVMTAWSTLQALDAAKAAYEATALAPSTGGHTPLARATMLPDGQQARSRIDEQLQRLDKQATASAAPQRERFSPGELNLLRLCSQHRHGEAAPEDEVLKVMEGFVTVAPRCASACRLEALSLLKERDLSLLTSGVCSMQRYSRAPRAGNTPFGAAVESFLPALLGGTE